MENNPSSLERIYPATEAASIGGSETLELHLERYRFAEKYLVPGEVLDLACGSGYGSYLLATAGTHAVTGVDVDESAITYARLHYQHPAINFKTGDAMNYQTRNDIHNIVSLETIEHLPDPVLFVKNMTVQLRAGGRFIASAPITPSMDANPFHLTDFTLGSFSKLFTSCGLVEVARMIQVQSYQPGKLLGKTDPRSKGIRKNLLAYYFKHPVKAWLRAKSLLIDGFRNKYVVMVFEKKKEGR
jgi:2-polyprenyl-3-methyl-5-hydroxy-6-metoxy-1,4-benzoquinol methylase